MSVMLVFNKLSGAQLAAENMASPRDKIYLRGDTLQDEHGAVLAERRVDDCGRVFWNPIASHWGNVDSKAGDAVPKDRWNCQELVFVGVGRLNV